VSTKYGQMAAATVIGPMSGMPTVVARRPLPLETIPTPSAIYWPSQPVGIARTASQTPAPTPAPTNGGSCCGQ
jgi:hypothetical protein